MKNKRKNRQNTTIRKRFVSKGKKKLSYGGTIASGALSGALTGASLGAESFNPWLTAAGFIVGGATGLLSANEEKKSLDAQEKAKLEEENRINKLNKEIHLKNNANVLNSYPTEGFNQSGFYRDGGIIEDNLQNKPDNMYKTNKRLTGSRSIGSNNVAIPIGRSAMKMAGDKHGQDSDGDGREGIPYKGNEVEDGEIIYKTAIGDELVFSKRLGFAKMVEPFLVQRAAIEKDLNSTDKIKRNTALRKIQAIDDKVKQIYDQQQKVNGDNKTSAGNGQKFVEGGGISQKNKNLGTALTIGQMALPFIDRVFSQKKLNQIDRNIPEPTLNSYTMLDRTVDVSPQINELNQGQKALLDNINANTANSNTASARASFVTGKMIDSKNKIFAQQRAEQRKIDNANTIGVNETNKANTALINDHKLAQFGHTNDRIATEIGLNQGLFGSISNIITNLQKGVYQNEQLDTLALEYDLDPNAFDSYEALKAAILDRAKRKLEEANPTE